MNEDRVGEDINPRPQKRQRRDSSSSPETTVAAAPSPVASNLRPLPPAILLLSLPSILLHPPTHRNHALSLCLSLLALRRCLSLPDLDRDIECRAWTALAEIGMIVIDGGYEATGEEWAAGVGVEVEKAVTKALLIAQKHQSLQWLRLISHSSQQPSLASPTYQPYTIYSAHLHLIGLHIHTSDHSNAVACAVRLHTTALAQGWTDEAILLAQVVHLRVLVHFGVWEDVDGILQQVEGALGMEFESQKNSNADDAETGSQVTVQTPVGLGAQKITVEGLGTVKTMLAIHTLLLGVVYHTYAGSAEKTNTRLKLLHELLDGGALNLEGDGHIQIYLAPNTPCLHFSPTPPVVFYALAFLATSAAKRDPVGRNPKRRVFAVEGLNVMKRWEREILVPIYSSRREVVIIEDSMRNIRADLECEMIGLSILRNELASAHQLILNLTSTLRPPTHNIFPSYASRVSLHCAHLAHARGDVDTARKWYRVARQCAARSTPDEPTTDVTNQAKPVDDADANRHDRWVAACAWIGEICLRIGVIRQRTTIESQEELPDGCADVEREREWDALRAEGEEAVKECDGLGGALRSVAGVVRACLSQEVLAAKHYLKKSLTQATQAQDNYLRGLVLALISAYYLHTSPEHASAMLQAAEQLGAGLGAAKRKQMSQSQSQSQSQGQSQESEGPASGVPSEKDRVGNGPLRIWVGERFLELYRRAGDEGKIRKQLETNRRLKKAVETEAKEG
ncbi:hypothetical protein BD779DRAFT_1671467 [Infundibulicybe gibba]|nr:hypothetical protein BD779DRAFT_1671467 [Infundibulicybe gibba]